MSMKPMRDHLKHLTLALALAAGLGAGGAQALTTTTVINLGTPPGTWFDSGPLTTEIPTGTLPPRIHPQGGLLERVTVAERPIVGKTSSAPEQNHHQRNRT